MGVFLIAFFVLYFALGLFIATQAIKARRALAAREAWKEKPLERCDVYVQSVHKFNTLGLLEHFLIGTIFGPFRLVTALLSATFCAIVCRVVVQVDGWTKAAAGGKKKDGQGEGEPSAWATEVMTRVSNVCARICTWCFGALWIRRTGKLPQNLHSYTLLPNHSGWLDILLMLGEFSPAFVSKSEVAKAPVVGTVAKSMRALFVDREHPGGLTEAIAERQKQMQRKDSRWPPLLVFPEGTTSNGTVLLPFRKGAFTAGTPLQPLIIKFSDSSFPATWVSIPFVDCMLCMVSQVGFIVSLTFLDPVVPKPGTPPGALADSVRSTMARAGGFGLSDATLADKYILFDFIQKQLGQKRTFQAQAEARLKELSATKTSEKNDSKK